MKSLEVLQREINKAYGPGTIIRGSEIREDYLQRTSTGSLTIDWVLGGGWRTNQWHQVIGETTDGKSSTVLKAIAYNQAINPDFVALWVEAEELDKAWARTLGVNVDRLVLVPRNEMEIAMQIVLDHCKEQAIDMAVIDSLTALVPLDEDDRDMDENTVGLAARRVSQFFRKNGSAMRRSFVNVERPVTGVFTSQWREKIGVTYGDNRTSPHGRAKEFYCATTLELRRSALINDDEMKRRIRRRGSTDTTAKPVPVGQEIRLKAIKNKTASPYREALVDFYFSDALVDGVKHAAGTFDTDKEIMVMAQLLGVLVWTGGKWCDAAGIYEWKNRGEMEAAVTENDTVREQLLAQLREHL